MRGRRGCGTATPSAATPGADQGAVRQAGLRGRHPGRDALPQRPGHGRGELGVRRARRPRRRPGRLGQHLRERDRRAGRQRRPAVVHPGFPLRVRGRRPGRAIGDPLDLSWARRFGLWAAYAFGQPLPPAWPGVGRNAFAHESGIHADGALKDRRQLRAVRRRGARAVPLRLARARGPGGADRRVRRQGRVPARPGRAGHRGRRAATRTWCSRWSSCARRPPASR